MFDSQSFDKIEEKCREMHESPDEYRHWQDTLAEIKALQKPKLTEEDLNKINLAFLVEYESPFQNLEERLTDLSNIIANERTKKNPKNQKIKESKARIAAIDEIIEHEEVLEMFKERKSNANKAIAKFFEEKGNMGKVFTGARYFTEIEALNDNIQVFMFVLEKPEIKEEMLDKLPKEFANIVEYIDVQMRKLITPERFKIGKFELDIGKLKNLEYKLLCFGEFNQNQFHRRISAGSHKISTDFKQMSFLDIFMSVCKTPHAIKTIMKLEMSTHGSCTALFCGEIKLMNYFQTIFQILSSRYFKAIEFEQCLICFELFHETKLMLLHPAKDVESFAHRDGYLIHSTKMKKLITEAMKHEKHKMCFDCFLDWFNDHKECPVCRYALGKEAIESKREFILKSKYVAKNLEKI